MTDQSIIDAREMVAKYGHLDYPVGKDRATLCHAAVVLADGYKVLEDKLASYPWTLGEIERADLKAKVTVAKIESGVLKGEYEDKIKVLEEKIVGLVAALEQSRCNFYPNGDLCCSKCPRCATLKDAAPLLAKVRAETLDSILENVLCPSCTARVSECKCGFIVGWKEAIIRQDAHIKYATTLRKED